MSVFDPRRTFGALFDHLVGNGQYVGPHLDTESARSIQVDGEFKFGHLLHRQVGGLRTFEDFTLQFEGLMRQWDVTGKWMPISDKKPSSIIDGTSKWIGPMWSQIDEYLILRYTPKTTQFIPGAKVVLDLKEYPMVMEELSKVPIHARHGPLIVNPRTGLPYRNWYYGEVWRKVRKMAGIRKEVWNRDTRAGAITEGRQAAAATDDLAKNAGHANERTTARVYDRDRLEAARRVAKARVAHRGTQSDRGVS